MALIIEDGSNVASANSYGTVTGFTAYGKARNAHVHGADDLLESHLIKGMDFIEAQHAKFQGQITTEGQALQWPRLDVYVDGLSISSTTIPNILIYALYALAMESFAGNDLQPTRQEKDPGGLTKVKVSTLELEYSEAQPGKSFTPAFSKANALLAQLYKRSGLTLTRS